MTTTIAKPRTLADLKVTVSGSGYASVSATDTAKLVRHALKLDFPGVKFQVKTSKYAGGASLDVFWTDGPPASQVERTLRPFEGSGFDGMQDLKTSHEAWLWPDGSAQRFASGIGQWGGAIIRDGSGGKLAEGEEHDYMAGLHLAYSGETTRRNYDETSDAFRLGQADGYGFKLAGALLVSFHADYIHTHRTLTEGARGELERAVVFLSGFDGEFDGNRRYDFALDDGPREGRVFADYGQTLVYQLSRLDDPADLTAAIEREAGRRAERGTRLFNEQARYNTPAGQGVTGYYVTIRDGSKVAPLLGPYDTRETAEACVDTARQLASEAAPTEAAFAGFGVTRATARPGDDLPAGKLEKLPARQLALAFGTETAA